MQPNMLLLLLLLVLLLLPLLVLVLVPLLLLLLLLLAGSWITEHATASAAFNVPHIIAWLASGLAAGVHASKQQRRLFGTGLVEHTALLLSGAICLALNVVKAATNNQTSGHYDQAAAHRVFPRSGGTCFTGTLLAHQAKAVPCLKHPKTISKVHGLATNPTFCHSRKC
jgi:hypothetical protein